MVNPFSFTLRNSFLNSCFRSSSLRSRRASWLECTALSYSLMYRLLMNNSPSTNKQYASERLTCPLLMDFISDPWSTMPASYFEWKWYSYRAFLFTISFVLATVKFMRCQDSGFRGQGFISALRQFHKPIFPKKSA